MCSINLFKFRRTIKAFAVLILVITVWPNYLFLRGSVKERSIGVVVNTNKTVSVDLHPIDLKYRPWKDDPECAKYSIEFIRSGTYPKMALASYPGSGNSWTRGLIERLSGYFTGSVRTKKNVQTFFIFFITLFCY